MRNRSTFWQQQNDHQSATHHGVGIASTGNSRGNNAASALSRGARLGADLLLGVPFMSRSIVVSRYERDGGIIETLQPENGGELFYRSCAHGYCRYSSDLWQAELYLDHLLAR